MIIEDKKTPKVFDPIEVTLVIESQSEYDMLLDLFERAYEYRVTVNREIMEITNKLKEAYRE